MLFEIRKSANNSNLIRLVEAVMFIKSAGRKDL